MGATGVLVDMAVLWLLADPRGLHLDVTLSKICSAETALASNFLWNELWTFRKRRPAGERVKPRERLLSKGAARRFLVFNAICGAGIALAVLLLSLFHTGLGWNLYLSNMLAILLVTCWNFALNARFNWGRLK